MYFIHIHGYICEICFISLIRKYDNNNFYLVGTINNDIGFDQFALFTVMVLSSVPDPWHFGVDPDPDADPCLWLMDPDADPAIFDIDLKDVNKQQIFYKSFSAR